MRQNIYFFLQHLFACFTLKDDQYPLLRAQNLVPQGTTSEEARRPHCYKTSCHKERQDKSIQHPTAATPCSLPAASLPLQVPAGPRTPAAQTARLLGGPTARWLTAKAHSLSGLLPGFTERGSEITVKGKETRPLILAIKQFRLVKQKRMWLQLKWNQSLAIINPLTVIQTRFECKWLQHSQCL